VDSGPAEWWQILAALGPLAVLLGALLAAFIGWNTLRQRTSADAKALAQKRESDNRAEWWKRTQWAIDRSMSDERDRAKLGLRVMSVLAASALAGPEELKIVTSAWVDPLEVAERRQASEAGPQAETAWIGANQGVYQATTRGRTGNVDEGPEAGDNEKTTMEEDREALSIMTAQESDRERDSSAPVKEPKHAAASPRLPHRPASYDRGVQIAAAQLRLVTDRRLGQTTPEWIKELAREEPESP
jgi:hypothetical protein